MTATTKQEMSRKDTYAAVLAKLPTVFARCTTEDSNPKYDLAGPAVIGGHAYCTDGRMCVRIRVDTTLAAEINAARDGRRFPQTAPDLFDGEFRRPVDPPDLTGQPACPKCRGKGTLAAVVCQKCDGEGVRECGECGHVYECRKCDGKGYLPKPGVTMACDQCDGDGYDYTAKVKVGPVTLAARYVKRIRDAGATVQIASDNPERTQVRFATPDGRIEGIVMPMCVEG